MPAVLPVSVLQGARVSWCRHLTLDDGRWRACLVCGVLYDRGRVLAQLREAIRARHRLPPSPWTAAERSVDTA